MINEKNELTTVIVGVDSWLAKIVSLVFFETRLAREPLGLRVNACGSWNDDTWNSFAARAR